MKRKVNVLVTALGGGSHGLQILKALRLGSLTYNIVGANVSKRCVGRAMVDTFELLPPANDPTYLDRLQLIIEKHKIQALFHGCENEMEVFAHNRERIEAMGAYVPVNPEQVIHICQDKAATNAFLARHGFQSPKFAAIQQIKDSENINFFPVVLKPIPGGGSAHVHIAQTREELEMFVRYLLDFCPKILAQEYVGTPDAEFTVGVLFGRDGTLINSIAIRRIVQEALSTRLRLPNKTGRLELGGSLVISSGISQGFVGKFPEVTNVCEHMASKLGAQAPVNIQCRLVDGAVMVFEINPRFSGTTSLRAMLNYNEPDVLIRRDIFGEDIPLNFPFASGMILRSLRETLVNET